MYTSQYTTDTIKASVVLIAFYPWLQVKNGLSPNPNPNLNPIPINCFYQLPHPEASGLKICPLANSSHGADVRSAHLPICFLPELSILCICRVSCVAFVAFVALHTLHMLC